MDIPSSGRVWLERWYVSLSALLLSAYLLHRYSFLHISGTYLTYLNQYSVDDLRALLEDTIRDIQLLAHVKRTHVVTVHAIYETAEPS